MDSVAKFVELIMDLCQYVSKLYLWTLTYPGYQVKWMRKLMLQPPRDVSPLFGRETATSLSGSMLDLFASIVLLCATSVIVSTNSIHSVIFLILVFCNATGLLVASSPKIEFIAIMFLIIYVGAIAVLFLFVVMMLNVREAPASWQRQAATASAPLVCFFVFQLVCPSSLYMFPYQSSQLPALTSVQPLGSILYTYYFYFLLMAGLILLVAMIGAIVLVVYKRINAPKKQLIFEQVARRFEDAIRYAQ